MSKVVIRSKTNTFVKFDKQDSVNLPEDKKVFIEKNTELELSDIAGVEVKHQAIILKDAIAGYRYQAGYIYTLDWEILESDDPDAIMQSQSKDLMVQKQIDRLSRYLPVGKTLSLNVKTKYFSQRDNYTMPHRTCCSSSNAMYLDWLLRVVDKKGLDGDDGYLKAVLQRGDTIYHHIQTQAIQEYGFSTQWMTNANITFVRALVNEGFPVVVNILHRGSAEAPRGGHIIMLIGRKDREWIVHDPYGTLSSDYTNLNGAFSRISDRDFSMRWQGGYRILA
jgi:hypothetical protein